MPIRILDILKLVYSDGETAVKEGRSDPVSVAKERLSAERRNFLKIGSGGATLAGPDGNWLVAAYYFITLLAVFGFLIQAIQRGWM